MIRRFALLLFALSSTAVAADQPALVGQLQGRIYTSPTGVFRIAIPAAPQLGGTISDTANVVTFEDGINLHLTIAAFSQNAAQRRELEVRGIKGYLVYFFENFVLPEMRRTFPGTTVERAVFVPTFQGGALLTPTLLPGGSRFAGRGVIDVNGGALATRGNRTEDSIVAKRGNLLFVRSGYVFVVSTELAERVLERATYRKTADEEHALLRQRLLSYVERMEFLTPPPAAAK